MNAKAKGSRAERRSREILESMGYAVCKSGASLGAWDLIGISKSDVCLVQVKTRDWPGSVEMETLRLFEVPPFNCRKLIHRWRDRVSSPDVKEL